MIRIEKFSTKNVFSFVTKPINVLYLGIVMEERIYIQWRAKKIFYLILQVSYYEAWISRIDKLT